MQSHCGHDGQPLGKNTPFDTCVMPTGHGGGIAHGGHWQRSHPRVTHDSQPSRRGAVVMLAR
jgi:hypothetical protein